jgi:hypothetical protein
VSITVISPPIIFSRNAPEKAKVMGGCDDYISTKAIVSCFHRLAAE